MSARFHDFMVRQVSERPTQLFLVCAAANLGLAAIEANPVRELNAFIAVACVTLTLIK